MRWRDVLGCVYTLPISYLEYLSHYDVPIVV